MLAVYLWGLPVAYLVVCYWFTSALSEGEPYTLVETLHVALVGLGLVLAWPVTALVKRDLSPLTAVMALMVGLSLAWPVTLPIALWVWVGSCRASRSMR